MALIGNQMQPQGQPQGEPQQAAPQQNQGAEQASKAIIQAAVTALNQDEVESHIIELVRSSENPVQGLAKATVFLMGAIEEQAKGTPPEEAIIPAYVGVMGEIAKMCKAAGVLKEVSPEILQQAMTEATQMSGQEGAEQQGPAAQPQPPQPGV